MSTPNVTTFDELGRIPVQAGVYGDNARSQTGAVSWGAVAAGAAAAAALSLILLMLGIGLGLSAVSPWKQDGISATGFGISTIAWITFTQLVASGMGGYLAGRLRTRWVAIHTDEVYFRDTAHGFLAWAVASLTTAALLTSAIGSMISGGVQAGATVASGAATAGALSAGAAQDNAGIARVGGDSGSTGYFVDSLFRKEIGATTGTTTITATTSPAPFAGNTLVSTASEVTRILMNTVRTEALSAEDVRYVGQVVAQRTGLTQQDAEKRVNDTYARMQAKLRDAETTAKEAADKGRKASAYAALWLFISLLIGAFIASFAATYGGRRRDA